MSFAQKCRVCGCMENRACITADGPCYWVEQDLCSRCAREEYNRNGYQLTPETVRVIERGLGFETNVGTMVAVIAALQLACRHPNFDGASRPLVEGWARMVQAEISVTGQLKFILEAGWDETMDVQAESKIIIPG